MPLRIGDFRIAGITQRTSSSPGPAYPRSMVEAPELSILPNVGLPRYRMREAPLASASSRPLTFTVAELAPLTPLRLPLPGFDNHATRGHHVEGINTIVDPLSSSQSVKPCSR